MCTPLNMNWLTVSYSKCVNWETDALKPDRISGLHITGIRPNIQPNIQSDIWLDILSEIKFNIRLWLDIRYPAEYLMPVHPTFCNGCVPPLPALHSLKVRWFIGKDVIKTWILSLSACVKEGDRTIKTMINMISTQGYIFLLTLPPPSGWYKSIKYRYYKLSL